jgi:hypothetical protein
MGRGWKVVLVTIATLVAAPWVCADMTPVPCRTAGDPTSVSACHPADDQPWGSFNLPCSVIGGVDSVPVGFFAEVQGDAVQVSEPRPACILVDRQDSFGLCLYALLGLGLCKSAPCFKKMHIAFVPDWFHSGGPHQIGHSYSLDWDSLSAPVVCCAPSDHSPGQLSPPCRKCVIVALWRVSQFTSCALISRGPPRS